MDMKVSVLLLKKETPTNAAACAQALNAVLQIPEQEGFEMALRCNREDQYPIWIGNPESATTFAQDLEKHQLVLGREDYDSVEAATKRSEEINSVSTFSESKKFRKRAIIAGVALALIGIVAIFIALS